MVKQKKQNRMTAYSATAPYGSANMHPPRITVRVIVIVIPRLVLHRNYTLLPDDIDIAI